jgi:predicted unusual protein kinase regulating ubiquinone biosynthesis (AarF/ABC1/UbiB family)
MALSLRPQHVRRYKDIARLLVKYGHSDLLPHAGLTDALEFADRRTTADGLPADAKDLAADLEALGPTFVKLGQLLSTRADLLPPAYLEALARLQDKCEAFPYDDVVGIIEEELGVRVSNAFATFDPAPIAAASLGQVHRATMRDGRPVAVKVQRPGIEEQITTDLESIAEIAAFADRHSETGRRFGFAAMAAEFRVAMLHELDYRREASNLTTLAENLAEFDSIVVPVPVPDFTSGRVLTMTLVPGQNVSSISGFTLAEIDGDALARQLFDAYLKQILVDGFFHADPHPGNVLLTDDGRLALLDLGMVARVAPDMRDNLLKLLLAVAEGNGADTAEVIAELCDRRDDVDFDRTAFRRGVTELVADQQGATLQGTSAGVVIAGLSRVAGECGLRPVPELTMLGKALLNLDEVARTVAPNFQPDNAMGDQLAKIVRQRLLHSLSPSSVVGAAIDAKEFAERLPGRVNKVLESLAEGQLTLNIAGVDEEGLMQTMRNVANRVTMGLLLAALIVGAAMLVRVPTHSTLFGYPALAIVCFLVAAAGAIALLLSILIGDRRRR